MPAQTAATTDSIERLVPRYFTFASVADADTFACPMSNPVFASWVPATATASYGTVTIGTTGGLTTTLTFHLSATGAGTLVVYGTGN